METRNLSKKDRIINAVKNFGKLRPKLSHTSIMTVAALTLILFISFVIRLFPMRWEIDPTTGKTNLLLSEFDPYFQYRFTEKMVKDGFISWAIENEGKGWIDYQRWHPQGFYVAKGAFPGLPMTAAFLYKIVSMLGVGIDLMSFCALFPAIMATLACLAMYFLGKDFGGKPVGLLAALFLALEPSYIQRTSLGFFDDESIGIFALILFAFLFLKAIEEGKPASSTIKYALATGAVLSYFCAGWGAAYYPIGVITLFTLILIIMRRYTRKLFLAYSLTFGLGLLIAINVPKLSPNYLLTSAILPVAAVFGMLCLVEVITNMKTAKWKVISVIIFLGLILGGVIALWYAGYMQGIAGKFLYVINPLERETSPLYESVAEHRVSAWGSIYYEFGFLIIFFIIGLFFILGNLNNRNLFLLVFGLTSLYFACSMVRLFVLTAPAFSLLAAVGINGLLKPFVMLLKEPPKISVRKKFGLERVGREFSGIAVFLIFLILMVNLAFPMPRVYTQAYTPTTISGGSLSVSPQYLSKPVDEWINMLLYMRTTPLGATTVVCSWWDYGYWMTVLGNVTTLADNATINTTQIENIGFIFMANETQAMRMLKLYNASYILVFTTIRADTGGWINAGGDEGKWVWMAAISGKARERFIRDGFITERDMWNEKLDDVRALFGNYTLGWHFLGDKNNNNKVDNEELQPTQGQNSTIYKLMNYARERWIQVNKQGPAPTTQLIYFIEERIEGLNNKSGYNGIVPLVCLYKINWEKYYSEHPSG
ncbi:hypothetical protein KEJ37_00605 [Candidatus Bathyarchaeota archaeon]|nr:hypothetical protein [Candidatus Bathyarchaeota archaeon]